MKTLAQDRSRPAAVAAPWARLVVIAGVIAGLPPTPATLGGARIGPHRVQKPHPPRRSRPARNGPSVSALQVAPPSASPPAGSTAVDTIVTLTNRARQASGLLALSVDPALAEAAQIQAEQMAGLERMEHDLPGTPHPTLHDRLSSTSYAYAWAGENIGCAAPDPASIEALWLASPPHLENILRSAFTQIGVGIAHDREGQPYYCQVFACPR